MLDKYLVDLIKTGKNNPINSCADTLFILASAQIDFLIEFFFTLNISHEKLIDDSIHWLIKKNIENSDYGLNLFSLLTNQNMDSVDERNIFLKGRLVDLLNSYFSSGDKSALIGSFQQTGASQFSTIHFFAQILKYYYSLLSDCVKGSDEHEHIVSQIKMLENITDENIYANKVLKLYIWEQKFRDNWQIIKLSKIIFLFETKYKITDVTKNFEGKMVNLQNLNFDIMKTPVKSKGLYYFLKQIIIQIEINYVISEKEKENIMMEEEENEEEVYEKNMMETKDGQAVKKTFRKIKSRKIRKEESIEDSIQEKFGTTFFTVPYYSFYLSNQSRMRFEQNVDRSSKTTKAKSLITSIESFLFEMIVNQSILRNSSFSTMAS